MKEPLGTGDNERVAVACAPVITASLCGSMTAATPVTVTGLPTCAPPTENVTVPLGGVPPLLVVTVAAKVWPVDVEVVLVASFVIVKEDAVEVLVLKLASPL